MITNKVIEYLSGSGHKLDEAAFKAAIKGIRFSIDRNFGGEREEHPEGRRVRMPRPSGTWACGRQLVFNSLALPCEDYGWRSRLTFTHGDINEALGILLFRQALAVRGEEALIKSPDENGEQLELSTVFDPMQWDH